MASTGKVTVQIEADAKRALEVMADFDRALADLNKRLSKPNAINIFTARVQLLHQRVDALERRLDQLAEGGP